jgi:CubicO group peptidase (beta-lactamase class C family)
VRSPTGTSRSTSTSCRERVDALAARLIAAGATPGAAVAVADPERILWSGHYGEAGPGGKPVDSETLFQIGSISKSFTAACLLRQSEAGRLDLEADMQSVLPWFPLAGISVHHLLSHTGGIICSLGDPPSPKAEVLALADAARAPVESGFWYSNVGYQSLAYLLERLTGEPFAETYRREILVPLRLTRTEPLTTVEVRPRLAVGHEPLDDTRPWRLGDPLAPATWVEYRGGDGSVCATVEDLAAYGRSFLAGDAVAGRMGTPVVEDPEDGSMYGYGVWLRTAGDRRWVGHSGSTVGFRAQLWCDFEAGICAAAVVNGQTGSKLLAEHALRLAVGDDVPDPELEGLDDPAAAVALDPEPPEELRPICGLYRSHNPWAPTLRVGTHDGRPVAVAWGDASPLRPLADGSFRLGEPEWSPERLRFDLPHEGRFMRAVHGTTPFHRPE